MAAPRTAIYQPPSNDLPYLVVTVADSDYDMVPARTREEARVIAHSKQRAAKSGKGVSSNSTTR